MFLLTELSSGLTEKTLSRHFPFHLVPLPSLLLRLLLLLPSVPASPSVSPLVLLAPTERSQLSTSGDEDREPKWTRRDAGARFPPCGHSFTRS